MLNDLCELEGEPLHLMGHKKLNLMADTSGNIQLGLCSQHLAYAFLELLSPSYMKYRMAGEVLRARDTVITTWV